MGRGHVPCDPRCPVSNLWGDQFPLVALTGFSPFGPNGGSRVPKSFWAAHSRAFSWRVPCAVYEAWSAPTCCCVRPRPYVVAGYPPTWGFVGPRVRWRPVGAPKYWCCGPPGLRPVLGGPFVGVPLVAVGLSPGWYIAVWGCLLVLLGGAALCWRALVCQCGSAV